MKLHVLQKKSWKNQWTQILHTQYSYIFYKKKFVFLSFQRAWFWISRERALEEECGATSAIIAKNKQKFDNDSKESCIINEMLDWVWAAERLALLNYYFGDYGKLEEKQKQHIISFNLFYFRVITIFCNL